MSSLRLKRLRQLLPILLVGVLLLVSVAYAQTGWHHAGLVVRFSDGQVYTECVAFRGDSISGADLLQLAHIEVVTAASPMGTAVCKIQNEGCNYPSESCFCKCQGGAECSYWAYYHLIGGKWVYSKVGAGKYQVHDGDVEGWAWGSGTMGSSQVQPPLTSFSEVCPGYSAKSSEGNTSVFQSTYARLLLLVIVFLAFELYLRLAKKGR
jgi:hypothetical protein